MILKFLIILVLFDIFNSKETKSETFILLDSYQLLPEFENEFLIKKLNIQNKIKCLSLCLSDNDCIFIFYYQNECQLFNIKAMKYFSPLTNIQNDNKFYMRKSNGFKLSPNLTNYWSFDNNNLNDSVGGAHLYGGVNASFTNDRFGNSFSAIGLYIGYYQIPPGIYFYGGDLTIMAWVKLRSHNTFQRLVDFGNGPRNNNVVLALNINGPPYFEIYQSSSSKVISNKTLDLNKWQHLACVLSGNTQQIYINGIQSGSSMSTFKPSMINRTSNYLGKSNWLNDSNTNADIDDLKIFNRALSQFEIVFEMSNNI